MVLFVLKQPYTYFWAQFCMENGTYVDSLRCQKRCAILSQTAILAKRYGLPALLPVYARERQWVGKPLCSQA